MKLLHTADWHLGQRLLEFDRKEEHQFVLDWFIKTIENERVDVLIIAGDIFDTANPPNYALTQYYQFLRDLLKTSCKHIIIIGGNHDSPSLLNAPSDLLRNLDIHIIGGASRSLEGDIDYANEIVPLTNKKTGELEAIVAAVPFLRDRDLRFSISGEKSEERAKGIREAIAQHYREVAAASEKKYDMNAVPFIATGHLYVNGSTLSDSEKDIHLGNLGQVSVEIFPSSFDYVALGHIHKPQIIGKNEHIRYSGSPIPLSFSEYLDKKQVNFVQFENGKCVEVTSHEIPVPRKLLRVKGKLEEVLEKLKNIPDHTALKSWVEIVVIEPDSSNALIEDRLREEGKMHEHFDILKIRIEKTYNSNVFNTFSQHLEEITPEEVFLKKCESDEFSEEKVTALQAAFLELMNDISEKDKQ